jgi:hypothetical protein
MSITRYRITDGANGRPIISQVVVRGDTVYVRGVTPDPVGDITSQTQTEEGDAHTLEVIVRYQACRATDGCLPSSVRLELPLKAADHVERPRRQ